jgi:hypothetical protein
VQAVSNTGYIDNNNTSPVTFTLPASPAIGDLVYFTGSAPAGFTIAQNAGQYVNLSDLKTWSALSGTDWTQIETQGNTWEISMAASSDGETVLALSHWTNTVNVSRNGGATWSSPTTPISDVNLGGATMSPDGSTMYIRSFDGTKGFYVSTDYGATWTEQTSMTSVDAMAAYDGGVVAIGTVGGTLGVYGSINDGASWTAYSIPGVPTGPCWSSIAVSYDGTSIVTGGDGNGSCPLIPVFVSQDSGATWVASGASGPLQNRNQQVAVSPGGNEVVVTSANGGIPIFVSTDGGASWTSSGSFQAIAGPAAISANGQRIVAPGSGSASVFVSNNGGATWTTQSTPTLVSTLAASSDLASVYYGSSRGVTAGPVLKSTSKQNLSGKTTMGTAGSVTLGGSDAIELQYLGNGKWGVLSYVGDDFVVQ